MVEVVREVTHFSGCNLEAFSEIHITVLVKVSGCALERLSDVGDAAGKTVTGNGRIAEGDAVGGAAERQQALPPALR